MKIASIYSRVSDWDKVSMNIIFKLLDNVKTYQSIIITVSDGCLRFNNRKLPFCHVGKDLLARKYEFQLLCIEETGFIDYPCLWKIIWTVEYNQLFSGKIVREHAYRKCYYSWSALAPIFPPATSVNIDCRLSSVDSLGCDRCSSPREIFFLKATQFSQF